MRQEQMLAISNFLRTLPDLQFAILYGSAAESDTFRDVDIALFVDPASAATEHDLELSFAVANQLERLVPYPVDVRVINDAPLTFRYNVSRGRPLLVNHEEIYFHFLEHTWDQYLDFAPVAMQYLREMA